jgi:hypothetical protein
MYVQASKVDMYLLNKGVDMLYTTINKLREETACQLGFKKVLKFVGSNFGGDEKIPLSDIIKSNDIDDAIWALRATTECSKKVYQQIALFCAESSLSIYEKKYPDDKRVRECIEATKKYIAGEIKIDELIKFKRAASAASYAAASYAAASSASSAVAAAYGAYGAASAAASSAVDAAYGADAKKEFKKKLEIKLLELLNE